MLMLAVRLWAMGGRVRGLWPFGAAGIIAVVTVVAGRGVAVAAPRGPGRLRKVPGRRKAPSLWASLAWRRRMRCTFQHPAGAEARSFKH
jgi:hypothetical protein